MARLSAVACGLALCAGGASAFLAPSMPRTPSKMNAVAAPAAAPQARAKVRFCVVCGG